VLPGIGPLATIAMLLPITYKLSDPTTALIMLAGIYYGAQYGGSTTAILVNLPGEISSVVTTLDGYQMARQGRPGAALSIAAIGSFVAGSVATLLIAGFAPPLAEVAFKFGPAEYFSLMVLGLIAAVVLAHGSILKALAMVVLGLLIGMVGTDVNSGVARFSFDIPELTDGIELAAVAMGIFGFGEIIVNLEQRDNREVFTRSVGRLLPSMAEFKASIAPIIRGTALGSFLGIPTNAVMALMVAGMMIHNIQPGPQVMTSNPTLFWGLIASMWIGNLMLVILNLPLIGIWIKLLTVPYRILYPAILLFCCVGAYSINNNVFDVFVTIPFAILGYVFRKLDCEPAPLLLGLVLGKLMEEYLRRAMTISRGDWSVFVTRPLSATLLAIAVVLLVIVFMPAIAKKRNEAFAEEET